MSYIKGIDISKHNWAGKAPVDFAQVRAAGAQFAILRAGYGWYSGQQDPYFERGYQQASAAGLAVGAYWYSYAVTVEQARQEATLCLTTLQGKRLGMGVWFDQEYEPSILALDNAQRTSIVQAFCGALRQAGWQCGLYCSRDWLNTKLDAAALAGTEIWVAAYTGGEGPGQVALPYGIWQYAGGSGRWPGVDGPCDLDLAYKDYPALMRAQGLCGFKKEEDKQMEFEPITGKVLRCTSAAKPKCEIFSAPDVEAACGALELGQSYPITAQGDEVQVGGMAGAWYMIEADGAEVYCLALPDGRCLVEDKPAVATLGEVTGLTGQDLAAVSHIIRAMGGRAEV